MRLRSSKNIAITFFEITVVIAIIVVLAVLLMAALGRAQNQAKASLYANYIRQLLAGRQAWVAENDGATIPPRPPSPSDPNQICTWRWYLNQKYDVPTKTFRCPSAHSAQREAAEPDLDSNYAALGDTPWNGSVSLTTIEHGSQQLVLLETRDTAPVLIRTDWKKTLGDGKGVIEYCA